MRLTGELTPLRGGCSRNTVGETCLVMPMCKDSGGHCVSCVQTTSECHTREHVQESSHGSECPCHGAALEETGKDHSGGWG